MAQGVVDHLESVEVQEQHADHPVVAGRPMQRILQTVQQQGPVGESGELVVIGPLLELGGHLDPFGDVPGVDYHAGHSRIAEQVGGHDLHVAPAALGVGHPCLGGR